MGEETGTGFVHVVAADGVEEGAARGVAEGEFVDEIVAELEAGGDGGGAIENRKRRGAGEAEAEHAAAVALVELVSVDGVVEEVSEVREEVQPIGERVNVEVCFGVGGARGPIEGKAGAIRLAAVGGIDVAEAIEGAAGDGAERDLIGGIPAGAVGEGGEGKFAIAGGGPRVAGEGAVTAEIFGEHPRAVVVGGFEAEGGRGGGGVRGGGKGAEDGGADDETGEVVFAEFDGGETCREGFEEAEARGAGGGKVADVGGEGALGVVDALHEFGDDEVEVGVALPVGVRAEVDGQAVDAEGEVGAVVEVEAAEEILVGFAAAGMLRDDDSGDDFEEFAAAQEGTRGELDVADAALRSGLGRAEQIGGAAEDGNGRERGGWCGGCLG